VDWTVEMSPFPLSMLHKGEWLWNPSGSMALERPDTSVKHVLKFRAARLCKLSKTSVDAATMAANNDQSGIVDLALHATGSIKSPADQNVTEVLWRMLVANTLNGKTPAPHKAGQGFVYNYISTIVVQLGDNEDKFESKLNNMRNQISQLREKDPFTVFPSDLEVLNIARVFFHRSPMEKFSSICRISCLSLKI
jgi:hypothetical protein